MDGFFVAKLKKFSNIIPTAPPGNGKSFCHSFMPTFIMIFSLSSLSNICLCCCCCRRWEGRGSWDDSGHRRSWREKVQERQDKEDCPQQGRRPEARKQSQWNSSHEKSNHQLTRQKGVAYWTKKGKSRQDGWRNCEGHRSQEGNRWW